MSIRNRWRDWRCHRGHHHWQRLHDGIWDGAYVICTNCERREVHGGDQYGPAARAWTALGIAPPSPVDGLMFTADQWNEWNRQVRLAHRETVARRGDG